MAKKSKSTDMLIDLFCKKCPFGTRIVIALDGDGVYTIAEKYCPRCGGRLTRTIVDAPESITGEDRVEEPVVTKSNESEDKTTAKDPISRPTTNVEGPKNGNSNSETSSS